MNAQPKYTTKGPGDLSGPDDPQSATDSMVDCPGTMWEWLHEAGNAALLAEFRDGALELLLDYVAAPYKDIYARNKLQRQMVELAQRCEEAIRRAESNDEMRGWYGRKRA